MRDRSRHSAASMPWPSTHCALSITIWAHAMLASSLRSLGLFAIENDDALRARIVGGAMGYRGDIPQLCREVIA